MRRRESLQEFSRRGPTVVIVSLCAALLAYWSEAPVWIPYSLAVALVGLALILMARGDREPRGSNNDRGDANWLTNELAGYGSPGGTYPLAFFAIVTLALIGFDGAYALPAWATLVFIAAWAVANAQSPPLEES